MLKRYFSLGSSAALAAGLLLSGVANADTDKLRERANQLFKPVPTAEDIIKERNLNADQIELGRMLFFEPRISKSHIITCNTCHSLGTGGADNVPTSIGHNWDAGPRNSPTVLNAVFNATQFWDGRAGDLQEQAEGPIQADVEMNATPEMVEEVLNSIPAYQELFAKAFANDKKPVTFTNATEAIGVFEKTLVTPNASFDKFLAGEDALNDEEQKGLALFMDKGCTACHSGVNLGGQSFFKFGQVQAPDEKVRPASDKGLADLTGDANQEYFFRASPLRNIALTAPYFHSGVVWSLEEAIDIMAKAQLGQTLEKDEIGAIAAFLHTLTGEQPKVEYPILPASTAKTPKPDSN